MREKEEYGKNYREQVAMREILREAAEVIRSYFAIDREVPAASVSISGSSFLQLAIAEDDSGDERDEAVDQDQEADPASSDDQSDNVVLEGPMSADYGDAEVDTQADSNDDSTQLDLDDSDTTAGADADLVETTSDTGNNGELQLGLEGVSATGEGAEDESDTTADAETKGQNEEQRTSETDANQSNQGVDAGSGKSEAAPVTSALRGMHEITLLVRKMTTETNTLLRRLNK